MFEDDEDEDNRDETDEEQPAVSVTGNVAPAPTQQTAGRGEVPYGDEFIKAGTRYGVPPELLAAQARVESGFNPNARSPAGAEGISQFMPGTARQYGVDTRSAPSSIDGQARYMRQALDKHNGDVAAALMEYHGGPDQRQWGPRTHAYAQSVTAGLIPTDVSGARAQPIPTDTSGAKAQLASTGGEGVTPDQLLQRIQTLHPHTQDNVGPVPEKTDLDRLSDKIAAKAAAFNGADPISVKYGPADPLALADVAHALSYAPGVLWRSIAEGFGGIVDGLSELNKHGMMSPNNTLSLLDPQAAETVKSNGYLPENLNAPAPTLRAGTMDLRTLFGAIPLTSTATAAELGDQDFGANLVSNLVRGAGWGLSAGPVRAAGRAAAALAEGVSARALSTAAWRAVGRQATVGAATYGMGQEAAHDLTGVRDTPYESAVGAALGIGLDLGRIGMVEGLGKALHYGADKSGLIASMFKPEAAFGRFSVDPAGAAQEFERGTPAMPVGFKVPPGVATSDLGINALYGLATHEDNVASKSFADMLQSNTQAVRNEASAMAPTMTREDAINWLEQRQSIREEAIHRRLMVAQDQADRSATAVERDLANDPTYEASLLRQGDPGQAARDAQLARGVVLHNHLLEAEDDTRAMAQAHYKAAEAAGVMDTPIEAERYMDSVRTAAVDALENNGPTGPDHFPWEQVNALYKQAPRELLAEGKSQEEAFGSANWKAGALDDVKDLHGFRSDLLDTARAEKQKWSQPGQAGDARLIRWVNQLAGNAHDEIERATTAAGNNKYLVDANRAFKQYQQTFNSGPIGKLTAFDYEGLPTTQPEQVLAKFLSTSPAAQATVGRLYDAIVAARGTGAEHPLTTAANQLGMAIRQEFSRVFHSAADGGKAARTWLDNHWRLFGENAPPTFQQMRQEFQSAINDAQSLQSAKLSHDADIADIERIRGHTYLGSDAERELDLALRGNVRANMQTLVDRALGDTSGRAIKGTAQLLGYRLLKEGFVPDVLAGGEGTFSGAEVKNWYEAVGKPAFAALEPHVPGVSARAERIVNAMQILDKMRDAPEVAKALNMSKKDIELISSGLFGVVGQLGGASVGRHIFRTFGIGGPIQTPAIGSEVGKNLVNAGMARLSRAQVAGVLTKALTTDEATFRALLQGANSVAASQALAKLVPPPPSMIRAFPSAVRANLDEAQNEQQPQTPAAPPSPQAQSPASGAPALTPGATLRGSVPLTRRGQ